MTRHALDDAAAPEATAAAVLDRPALEAWAGRLGRRAAEHGVFVALYGALGSGKSTLVRAACRAVGIEGPVPSPTYTLVHEYPLPTGRRLYHADLYRLEAADEVWEIGWEALIRAAGPVFVEWAERARRFLPQDRWDVCLDLVPDPERRRVRAEARGNAPPVPAPPRDPGDSGRGADEGSPPEPRAC